MLRVRGRGVGLRGNRECIHSLHSQWPTTTPLPPEATPEPNDRTVAMQQTHTSDWFRQRTFHHGQFEPVTDLVEAKRRAGLTISLCIPTRNEAATIGKVVRVLREALVVEHPLVDELTIMDAGSSDGTAAVAADEGAGVHLEQDFLPEEGPGSGKGEGLWKSVHSCTGDIVCWVDADISNIHPRFVTGLIGPLLAERSILFTKGFYTRPIAERGGYRENEGGRVTELMARPLLNAFWPELGGMIQPLSGEFAGRRELLERIPFYSGYGVELGMLVDIVKTAGIDAIAQVDLDRRVHRNQPIAALSRMSFGILQTAMQHLAAEGRVTPSTWSTLYQQFSSDGERYATEPRELPISRRPPLIDVEGYRRRAAARERR
jgi:glucosyl-3-phosphoglycerate synthase